VARPSRRAGSAAAIRQPRPRQTPGDASSAVSTPTPQQRRRSTLALIAATAATLAFFVALRLAAPHPWDYDEYYHVWLARALRDGMPTSLPWTPFSLTYRHFSDPVPLYHLAMSPFAGLRLEWATLAGAAIGQLLVVAAFAWALWVHRVPRAPLYLLALTGLGTQFVSRMAMCRPHHGEVAFTILFVTLLLVDAPLLALLVVAALFGLFHASGWMPILFALLWLLAPQRVAAVSRPRRWRILGATSAGWALGQLLHPNLLENLRLLWTVNVTILGQSARGDDALRSQIGMELQALEGKALLEQWPTLLAAGLLAYLVVTRPAWRRREVLVVGFLALAFLVPAVAVWPRFFELAAPLSILALALGTSGGGGAAEPPSRRTVIAFGCLVLLAATLTVARLRERHVGQVAVPDAMARWLGEHGRPGERVFTGNWADAAPLVYYAPQLQSMVVLDPTPFWLADRELFGLYVRILRGEEARPAATIRQRFGARWVTIWKAPNLKRFATQLATSGEATVAYADPFYLVFDLGEPGVRPLPRALADG
jgi:hypothetical protein